MFRRLLGLAILISLSGLNACTQVQGDEVGIRVCNFYKGVERAPKKTGTHLYIPVLFDFYYFPKTQQKLEMVESQVPALILEEERRREAPAKDKSYELDLNRITQQMEKIQAVQVIPHKLAEGKENIRLKTADGNDIWIDVMLAYQVIEDLAPVLAQRVGTDMQTVEKVVGVEARGIVREVMGELNTKDFYQADLREQKLEQAKKTLNERLNPFGIKINSLNINQFRFVPEYEDLIREKVLAEQKRQEYEQLALAAEKERDAKVAKAQGDAQAMVAIAEGRRETARLEGEAEMFSKNQQALAQETKLTKEAEGLRALVNRLAGLGGDNLLAKELASVLAGKPIIIVPQTGTINVLDLNELLQNYSAVETLKGQKKGKTRTGAESE